MHIGDDDEVQEYELVPLEEPAPEQLPAEQPDRELQPA